MKAETTVPVIEYYCLHGDEKTLETFKITAETLARYKRAYRSNYGQIDDRLIKIKEKYGDDYLDALLKADNKKMTRPAATYNFDGEKVKFIVISDTHFGSSHYKHEYLTSAIAEAEKQECQFLVHAGDVTEGMSNRPGHIYELSHIGYTNQRKYAIEQLKQFKGKKYIISGNHDYWYNTKSGIGADVVDDICAQLEDAEYLGVHEGTININGATVMLWHGEDGSSYAHSYRLQKIVEGFTGGEKPSVLIAGHCHKMAYIFERNIHVLSAGTLENQTPFMRFKRLAAHVGFWIVEMVIADGEVKRFTPSWYPFYK